MKNLAFFMLPFVMACGTGDFEQKCNRDGSCNSPNLQCDLSWHECRVRPPEPEPGKCRYQAECFCMACAEKCDDSGQVLSRCEYSDTSVWGSKPTVCECK